MLSLHKTPQAEQEHESMNVNLHLRFRYMATTNDRLEETIQPARWLDIPSNKYRSVQCQNCARKNATLEDAKAAQRRVEPETLSKLN